MGETSTAGCCANGARGAMVGDSETFPDGGSAEVEAAWRRRERLDDLMVEMDAAKGRGGSAGAELALYCLRLRALSIMESEAEGLAGKSRRRNGGGSETAENGGGELFVIRGLMAEIEDDLCRGAMSFPELISVNEEGESSQPQCPLRGTSAIPLQCAPGLSLSESTKKEKIPWLSAPLKETHPSSSSFCRGGNDCSSSSSSSSAHRESRGSQPSAESSQRTNVWGDFKKKCQPEVENFIPIPDSMSALDGNFRVPGRSTTPNHVRENTSKTFSKNGMCPQSVPKYPGPHITTAAAKLALDAQREQEQYQHQHQHQRYRGCTASEAQSDVYESSSPPPYAAAQGGGCGRPFVAPRSIGLSRSKKARVDDLRGTSGVAQGGDGHLGVYSKTGGGAAAKLSATEEAENSELPPELAKHDKELVEKIMSEVIVGGKKVTLSDVAGLANAKKILYETVIYPLQRPDIFTGLRAPSKGVLLFGPPGTGKTYLARAIACESNSTFFCISASSIMSKWIGEGEKLIRVLFAVARYRAPSIVFLDEVDSLLSKRSEGEDDNIRRIKTEFLVQLDGAGVTEDGDSKRVLILGATNRPQELDEAVRRRFTKRVYVPLPEVESRRELLGNLLRDNFSDISEQDMASIVEKTEGFSGSDLFSLCQSAAQGPIRDLTTTSIRDVQLSQVSPICARHFYDALRTTKPTVADHEIEHYIKWNTEFGCEGT